MPPKPDPTTPKRPVGRPKGTTKIALQQQQLESQAASLGLPLPKAKKKLDLTPYPDLSMAIAMLRHRMGQVGPQRVKLIEEWLKQLDDIHAGVTRLKKLEVFSDSLSAGSKPKF